MVKYIVVFASMVLGKGGRIWGQGECWGNTEFGGELGRGLEGVVKQELTRYELV